MKITKEQQTKINQLMQDCHTFNELYDYLHNEELGDWDRINSEDTIKQYISDMALKGIHVSHILKAIEENPSKEELYAIWLGNSMETPTPINTKKQLLEELEIEQNE